MPPTTAPPPSPPDFILGLDLGKSSDFTALAVVQRTVAPDPENPVRTLRSYAVRHLIRWPLKTSYHTIVAEVAALTKTDPINRPHWPLLAVDQTGVGIAVVEMVRKAGMPARLYPISITSGSAVTPGDDSSLHVPKKELVGVMQMLLQSRRLVFSPLPERDLLVRELDHFKVKITPTGGESFEAWRERDHDDLVLAVALACWLGQWMPDFEAPSSIPNPAQFRVGTARLDPYQNRGGAARLDPYQNRRPGGIPDNPYR
jgi:hypothetical protein